MGKIKFHADLPAGRLGRKDRKGSIFFANSAPLREIIRPVLLRADFLDSLRDNLCIFLRVDF